MRYEPRTTRRTLSIVAMIAAVSVAVVGTASASCISAFEPVDLVTGRLAGESVEEQFHVNLGRVLGIAELETVKVWDAGPDYTAASATVVTRYWGTPPPDERLFPDGSGYTLDGGHYTGPGAPENETSCEPSVAKALGSREYVAVFEVSNFIPIDPAVTPADVAIFTQYLGEPVTAEPAVLPEASPGTSADTSGGDVPIWLIASGAVALLAAGGIWLRRRKVAVAGGIED